MPSEAQIEAAAKAWTGAPFPSKASLAKARAALEAVEALEEVEWEYTWEGWNWLLDEQFTNVEQAQRWRQVIPGSLWVSGRDVHLVRRRKAGPWEPVEGETP